MLVPLPQLGKLCLVCGLRLGEGRFEPFDVGEKALLLGGCGLKASELRRGALVLLAELGELLLVRSLCLGESRFEVLDVDDETRLVGGGGPQALELGGGVLVLGPQLGERLLVIRLRLGQGALVLGRDRLGLDEGSLEALDLAAQLLQLRRIGLDNGPRLRALLGCGRRFLGSGVSSTSSVSATSVASSTSRASSAAASSGSGTATSSGCSSTTAGSGTSPVGVSSGGSGSSARAAPRPWGRAGASGARVRVSSAAGSSSTGAAPSAKPYSVLQSAAALHRQGVCDRRARRKAELDDDLAERALRLLLDLENGRELLLADQPELGHQLAELTLWHALGRRS